MSQDITALSDLGLEAMNLIETHRAPDEAWRRRADALLQRQVAFEAASSSFIRTVTSPGRPPADLLIAIAGPIGALVQAAETGARPAHQTNPGFSSQID